MTADLAGSSRPRGIPAGTDAGEATHSPDGWSS
jgi:hypothetical protein